MSASRPHASNSPRGSRRDWERDLELPTLLTLHTHGMARRRVASYGFVVWDVGENRLLMEHGAVVPEDIGVSWIGASYHALQAGLSWLVEHQAHRRRLQAYTDNPLLLDQLFGRRSVEREDHWDLLRDVQRMMRLCPLLELCLVAEEQNGRAIELALAAYVEGQEARRLARTDEVLKELLLVQPGVYLVGDRYRVDLEGGTCTCPDFTANQRRNLPIRCKHLLAAIRSAKDGH